MATAPKKSAPTPASQPAVRPAVRSPLRPVVRKKPRVSQAEASTKMLNVTSQLLLQFPPQEVTVQKICQGANVHTDYVVRYFGSREELLIQALETRTSEIIAQRTRDDSALQSIMRKKANAFEMEAVRFRTIAYLLGCGAEPERFQENIHLGRNLLISQAPNPGLSDRSKLNMVLIGSMIFQGMAMFGDVNSMTEQQKNDMLTFVGHLSQISESVEKDLGWDKPSPRKRK